MTKQILTQSRLKELINYNPKTGIFTWIVDRNHLAKKGYIVGCKHKRKNKKTYINTKIDNKSYQLHRLAFLYIEGKFPDDQVDHINGDGTDNRFINLRKVTNIENSRNQRKPIHNNSGICGVHYDKKSNKWISQIKINYKAKWIGAFNDKFEAICARKSAENKFNYHENHGQIRPL